MLSDRGIGRGYLSEGHDVGQGDEEGHLEGHVERVGEGAVPVQLKHPKVDVVPRQRARQHRQRLRHTRPVQSSQSVSQ
eukprot:2683619-Pyramimonas_sp.AAC.1